jgi:hypothetical protein
MQPIKKFDEFLNEARGVPDNIVNLANKLYDEILDLDLDMMDEIDGAFEGSDPNDKSLRSYLKTGFNGPFNISDFKISGIDFMIEKRVHPKMEGFSMISATQRNRSELTDNMKMAFEKTDRVFISLEFASNNIIDNDEIENFIKSHKSDIVSNLSHELKHAYDVYKKQYREIKDAAEYRSAQGGWGEIEPLNLFSRGIYYTSQAENLVRASEISADMGSQGVSKKDFYNFITNHEVYKTLKEFRDLTFESFKADLYNYIPQIKDAIVEMGDQPIDPDILQKDDNAIVEFILQVVVIIFSNKKTDIVKEIFHNDAMRQVAGLSLFDMLMRGKGPIKDPKGPQKQAFYEKYVKEATKYINRPNDYFKYEINRMSKTADKVMRKVSKIYADANESIINWDAWQKLHPVDWSKGKKINM